MTDIEFKVGDLIYHVTKDEFGIIYDHHIGGTFEADHGPIFNIYWQITQKTINYYLSTMKLTVNNHMWVHYPVGNQ
jgi:hypothetical protein